MPPGGFIATTTWSCVHVLYDHGLTGDGLTHSEIAGRLGIPVGTVKSRTVKAADTLRAELASLRGGGDAD